VTDPVASLAGLRQPDGLSCGATTVVAWRLLVDPAYRDRVGAPGSLDDVVLATHRRLVARRDEHGRAQVPWPRALGTPPWSLARAVGGRVVRPGWDRLAGPLAAGSPVAVYVGSRLLPLHVVLAVALRDGRVVAHDPARGRAVTFDRADLERHRLPFTGRPRAWWLVVPGA